VLARYDVLGFDPRGVAGSDPATCFPTQEEELASPLVTATYPLPGPEEASFVADTLRFAALCQSMSPRRFSTASTANVARDMDLLRQAVGDERLAYVGYSYGTYLGATYARLFPGRVGRFVLDGTIDPVAYSGTGQGDAAPTTPLGIRVRQGIGGTETFGEFARLCREGGPQRCSLAALGDPATVVTDIFDRLAREPLEISLPDGTTILLRQQDAVALTFFDLYSPAAWPALADVLAVLAAPVPSPTRVAAAIARTRSPLGARMRGEDYPSIGGGLASLCVDTAASGRVAEYPALVDAHDAEAPYFGRLRGWVALPCEFWRLRDPDAYHGPWQQRTKAPVLVIGTRFDPATPYRQTRPYADLFPVGGCSRSMVGVTPRSARACARTRRSPATSSVARRGTGPSALRTSCPSRRRPPRAGRCDPTCRRGCRCGERRLHLTCRLRAQLDHERPVI